MGGLLLARYFKANYIYVCVAHKNTESTRSNEKEILSSRVGNLHVNIVLNE